MAVNLITKYIDSTDFHNNIKPVTYDVLSSPSNCSNYLGDSIVRKAADHQSINASYVCGLNAARCCLLMKNYTKLPGINNFPYTYPVVDVESLRMGPKPDVYAEWIKQWCSGVSYKIQCSSWSEVHSFIITNLNEGNPVIALGSECFQAHYFPIVGWRSNCVFVLNADGQLHSASDDYIKFFMNVRIPTISGYSAIAIQ
jgi:hypothetical protein